MLRFVNDDEYGSRYIVSSKNFVSKPLVYATPPQHLLRVGRQTKVPDFTACQPRAYAYGGESPKPKNSYDNGYRWNETPHAGQAPSTNLNAF